MLYLKKKRNYSFFSVNDRRFFPFCFSIRMTDTLCVNMVEAMSDVSLATSDVYAHVGANI